MPCIIPKTGAEDIALYRQAGFGKHRKYNPLSHPLLLKALGRLEESGELEKSESERLKELKKELEPEEKSHANI